MTDSRKFFDEPIMRAKIGRVRFPKNCPVCGAPSTTLSRITTTPRKKQWLRPHWNPGFIPSDRRRLGLTLAEKKSFHVYVCEEHQVSDEGEWRIRFLAMFLVTIVGSLSIFVIMFGWSQFFLENEIRPWARFYLLVLFFSIGFGYFAFKPNALESAFQIIGFDFDVQYVWLNLRNAEYRNKFIEENPMNVELVNWIIWSKH